VCGAHSCSSERCGDVTVSCRVAVAEQALSTTVLMASERSSVAGSDRAVVDWQEYFNLRCIPAKDVLPQREFLAHSSLLGCVSPLL
jgi:hypothetical protein